MTDDGQLLRQYVRQGSQAAFAQLVARHLDFVYSVCRREVGDAALAEDVTQVVFLILAEKAPSLRVEPSLSGWLFQTARFAAKNARRREATRTMAEKNIREQMPPIGLDENALWDQIEPSLNNALAALGTQERAAVLLRFADGLSFPELGTALGMSEDAARMRLNRAVERLRRFFAKEGVTLSGTVLIGLLADRTVHAAPANCAAAVHQIARSVLPGGGNAGQIALTVYPQLKGALKAMTMTKITLTTAGILVASAAILPLVTLAQGHSKSHARKPVVRSLKTASPIGSFPDLALKDGFTLQYTVTEKDVRTLEMKATERQQMTNELQHSVQQGLLKQADADQSLQNLDANDKIPVTPHEYLVTLSARDGKLLYIRQQTGTPSYEMNASSQPALAPYQKIVVLYDGQKTYSMVSYPTELPHLRVEPAFRPTLMTDCLLPGVGLPSMPLAKVSSKSPAPAILCDVFTFNGNRYTPGTVSLQGKGSDATLTQMIVGSRDHPQEIWTFQEPQAFGGGWIARRAIHTTFPFLFSNKLTLPSPEKLANYTVTDIQPTPLKAAQFDIRSYLIPKMTIEEHSAQPYGMETHSFQYNPNGGDLAAQGRAAISH